MVTIRACSIGAAFVSALSAAFSIYLLVIALLHYRTDDLILASETKDFNALGTCIGTVSRDQLDASWLKRAADGDECSDEVRSDWVARSLAASVHGLYFVWNSNKAAGSTFENAGDVGVFSGMDAGTYTFGNVVRTVLSATALAGCKSCAGMTNTGYGSRDGSAAYEDSKYASNAVYASINATEAYDALWIIAGQSVPTSCDAVYGYSGSDAEGGAFAGNEYDMTTMPPTATSTTDTDDKAYAREYYRKLVEGDTGNNDWPLGKIRGTCANEDKIWPNTPAVPAEAAAAPAIGSSDWYGSMLPEDLTIDSRTKLVLYAHCLAQFRYATVGTTVPYRGSFGLPMPGEYPGPNKDFVYDLVDGSDVNSLNGNYTMKARLYQGMRFGYSVWAYIPMVLCSTFLCADAIVFFLAEAALPFVLQDAQLYESAYLIRMRNSLVMEASRQGARIARLTFGIFFLLFSIAFWFTFCYYPFNSLYESRMPRPFCEHATADVGGVSTSVGADPDHSTKDFDDFGFHGTKGGWKADWDASVYEFSAVILQVVILVLLPFTTTGIFNICNRVSLKQRDEGGRQIPIGERTVEGRVSISRRARQLQNVLIPTLAVGALVIIVTQSVSGARFGMSWAEGVVSTHRAVDANRDYNEVVVAEQVYNQTVLTLMLCISLGLLVGTSMQRYLIGGVGCFGAFFLLAWIVLVILCFLPVFVVAESSLVDPSEAEDDCELVFTSGDQPFAHGACVVRNWGFIVGGAVVLVVVILITCAGLVEALQQLRRQRSAAIVGDQNQSQLDYRWEFTPMSRQNVVSSKQARQVPGVDDASVLGGYRSHDEEFYNYTNKIDSHARTSKMLYLPRVQWDLSSTRKGRA
jgi:hypothetical protein